MITTGATTMHPPTSLLPEQPPATRSPAHDARAVLSALRSEWIKATTVRSNAAILVFALVAGLVAGFGGAVVAGLDAGDTSALATTIGWALLFTTLSAVLGLGISMIVRNSTAAIGGLLVWGFVVENLLNLFLPVEVARFLPFFAGNKLLAYTNDFDTPEALAVALTRAESALVFGGYAGVALLVGTLLLYRRDTT